MQVDQGQGGVAERPGRQPGAGHPLEAAPGRVEPGVVEGDWRQRLLVPVGRRGLVDPDDVDAGQQAHPVERRLGVGEAVLPRHPGHPVRGVGAHPDQPAPLGRAHLEPGSIVGERVRPGLVLELHRDQERRRPSITVVGVGDPPQQRMVPPVRGDVAGVGEVVVSNHVAEQVPGLGDPPGEDAPRVLRVGDHRRVLPARRSRCPIEGGQPVPGSHLPEVPAVGDVLDPGEQPLGPWPVPHPTRAWRGDRDQVLGARDDEHVRRIRRKLRWVGRVSVSGQPVGGLARHARHAQRPAQAERAVAVPGRVPQGQLRLQAESPGW